MSDIEIPNIEFDNEMALTVAHDVLNSGAENTKFIASVNSINTLGQNDFLTGGGGVDMLSLAAAGAYPTAVNFETDGVEIFEIKNAAFDMGSPSELWVNMIDVNGLETLWLRNNTGDSVFDNAQNLFDVVIDGGGFQGDVFNTDINFAPSVATGSDDTLELLVSGTRADFEVNNYPGANGVENLWLTATGGDSRLEFDIAGLNSVMGTGDANNLRLEQENWDGDMEYLSSIDFTGFTGNLTLFADVGVSGGATATVDSGKGADKLDLDGDDGSDKLMVTAGNGNDTVKAHGFGDVNIDLGKNKNKAILGWDGDDLDGNVTVSGMDGKDVVFVDADGSFTANVNAGKNKIVMDVGGSATIDAKGGDDKLFGSVSGDLDANLRSGQNKVDVYAWNISNLLTKNGNDTVDAHVGYNVNNADLGNGDNDIDITFGTGWGGQNWAYITTGDGDDSLQAASGAGDELVANLGEGDNDATISGMSTNSADITFGGGADEVFTMSRGLVGTDDIDFGGGNDKLYVNNLEILGSGDLGGVTAGSLENIYFKEVGASSTVDFNGASSGANAAGVMDYWTDGDYLDQSYNLDEMVDDVTLNLQDNGGTIGTFALDLAGNSGTANVNFIPYYYQSTTYINHFDVSNVATLNVDSGSGTYYGRTLNLGNGTGFTGDAELTTVNLSGSNHIYLRKVDADNLALIDGAGMSRNITLDLNNVAADISVKTGSGNDRVYRDSAGTNFDIETDGGYDSVYAGGGDDNIKLGDQNDYVYFTASQLDDFDTVDGGNHTDRMTITSGGLIGEGGDVVNDDFFFLISNMEDWFLNSSQDNIQLGNTAQSSGLESMSLGNGDDKVTLKASYSKALEITIGNGTSDDTVDAGLSGATLTVRAESSDLDGGDEITGGTGGMDELQIYQVNGGPVDLTGMTKVENITEVYHGWEYDSLIILAADENVDGLVGGVSTLTVDTSDYYFRGDLTFIGFAAENDGNYVVTSGYGDDIVVGGALGDTITTNWGDDLIGGLDGDDSISAGGNDDRVAGGLGNDTIDGGSGNDGLAGDQTTEGGVPIVGEGGIDVITGGTGADEIWGGAEADIIDVGNGAKDTDTDTVFYFDVSESSNGDVDQVSNFTDGVVGGDVIDLTFLPPAEGVVGYAGQQFVGNGASFGQSQGLLTNGDGVVDVVFQVDDQVLWVDVNDDGTLNADDLQIHLIGVTGLQDNMDGTSANLALDGGP